MASQDLEKRVKALEEKVKKIEAQLAAAPKDTGPRKPRESRVTKGYGE